MVTTCPRESHALTLALAAIAPSALSAGWIAEGAKLLPNCCFRRVLIFSCLGEKCLAFGLFHAVLNLAHNSEVGLS
jgi:hypothetical protein